jgi:hypothetical protein
LINFVEAKLGRLLLPPSDCRQAEEDRESGHPILQEKAPKCRKQKLIKNNRKET